jgi:hypothetical protein
MGDVVDFGKLKAPEIADVEEESVPAAACDPVIMRQERLERVQAAAAAATTAHDYWTVYLRAAARLQGLQAEHTSADEHVAQIGQHKAICEELMKSSARQVMTLMKGEPDFRRHIMRHGRLPEIAAKAGVSFE